MIILKVMFYNICIFNNSDIIANLLKFSQIRLFMIVYNYNIIIGIYIIDKFYFI